MFYIQLIVAVSFYDFLHFSDKGFIIKAEDVQVFKEAILKDYLFQLLQKLKKIGTSSINQSSCTVFPQFHIFYFHH